MLTNPKHIFPHRALAPSGPGARFGSPPWAPGDERSRGPPRRALRPRPGGPPRAAMNVRGETKAEGPEVPGIEGIKAEHDEFMKGHDPSQEICDMFLTGAAARTEHYEIAAYNGLITMAEQMDAGRMVDLLQRNLRQEESTLRKVESIGKRLAQGAVARG